MEGCGKSDASIYRVIWPSSFVCLRVGFLPSGVSAGREQARMLDVPPINAAYLMTNQLEIICVELRNFYWFIIFTGFLVLLTAVVPGR